MNQQLNLLQWWSQQMSQILITSKTVILLKIIKFNSKRSSWCSKTRGKAITFRDKQSKHW